MVVQVINIAGPRLWWSTRAAVAVVDLDIDVVMLTTRAISIVFFEMESVSFSWHAGRRYPSSTATVSLELVPIPTCGLWSAIVIIGGEVAR
jgi:hypothetical protein